MIIEEYTIKSAPLVSQNNDQNLSNAAQLNENTINAKLHHANTNRWSNVAFLRLNKSIQKKKKIMEVIIIINCNRLKCINSLKNINVILK